MTEAAEAAGIKTQVGFNYLCNPMMGFAKEMIASGELGEIRGYRGLHCEDYMTDTEAPPNFRHEPAGGGALADIGSHALATAEYLLGPIAEVMGHCVTAIPERPNDEGGGRRTMEVDDVGRGPSSCSRTAPPGRSRATGSRRGARCSTTSRSTAPRARLAFSQERFSELHYYSDGRCAGAARLPPHRSRAGSSALRPLLPGGGPSARLQRPKGDRDGGLRRCHGGQGTRRPSTSASRSAHPRS